MVLLLVAFVIMRLYYSGQYIQLQDFVEKRYIELVQTIKKELLVWKGAISEVASNIYNQLRGYGLQFFR